MDNKNHTNMYRNLIIRRGIISEAIVSNQDVMEPNSINGLKFFNYSTQTIVIHHRQGYITILTPRSYNLNKGIVIVRNYAMTFDNSIPNYLSTYKPHEPISGNLPAAYNFDGKSNYVEKINGRSTIVPSIRLDSELGSTDSDPDMLKSLRGFFGNKVNDSATYASDEIINVSELNTDVGVYLPLNDVVLSLGPNVNPLISHPYFSLGNVDHFIETMREVNNNNSYNPSIKLVDNNGEIGALFTLFHNKVIKLDPVRDPSMQDGLYVYGLRGNHTEYNLGEYTAYYVPLEDMFNEENDVRLFKSNRQVLEYKHSLDDTALTVKSEERDMALVSLTAKKDLAEKELDIANNKLDYLDRSSKVKVEFEEVRAKLEERKIYVEIVKLLSVGVVAGMTLWKLFSKR